ncbi:hypothetical protein CVT25_010779 [Psilocybe cyanescens]|uniref:Uncharacterized protein n=1 Tax=Psilocybe cyanescens TaxID=93625 RepID=A0A409XR11_PSICY|nr:hypothetical protein CVT25_010779 [Psilocybe cyanescens]
MCDAAIVQLALGSNGVDPNLPHILEHIERIKGAASIRIWGYMASAYVESASCQTIVPDSRDTDSLSTMTTTRGQRWSVLRVSTGVCVSSDGGNSNSKNEYAPLRLPSLNISNFHLTSSCPEARSKHRAL